MIRIGGGRARALGTKEEKRSSQCIAEIVLVR